MRIGIDIRSLQDRPLTGVGEYTLRLLSALFRIPSENRFVLFSSSLFSHPVLPKEWGEPRITHVHVRVPSKVFHASLFLFKQPRINALLGHIDCLFAPNLHVLPVSPSLPLLLTVHDCSFKHFPQFFSLRQRMWHATIQPARLFRRADRILAVSHATADDLNATFRVPKEKITVIHSGVTPVIVSDAERQDARRRLRLPSSFLLSLCTLEPRKNLLTLLEAYTVLRERGWYRGWLVIVGARGWSMGALRHALAQHPYQSTIAILPYLDETDKHACYELADCFCYPSLYEGFGFPPLEAALHGTPIVAGNHSSLSEMLGRCAVLVDVNNPNDLAQAIRLVTVNGDLRAALTTRAKERAHTFTWERAAQQTHDALVTLNHRHAHRY
jgi:glycosyltransferase involved in cell wall biosynthesis